MGKTCFDLFYMFILCGLLACSDEEKAGGANQMRVYGESYQLERGVVYHDNNHSVISVSDYYFADRYEWQGSDFVDTVKGFSAEVREKQTGNFLIGLYEDGFEVSDLVEGVVGEGACVCLRLASPDTSELQPGVYTFSDSRDEYTFQGHSAVCYNTREEDVVSSDLAEGKVVVEKAGDVYSISFQCKTSFGGDVEGSYSGPVSFLDIRKDVDLVSVIEDVDLEALFHEVNYVDAEGVAHEEPDYLRATAFFCTSSRQIYTANSYKDLAEVEKRKIDIALSYDREKEVVCFDSPIRMRSLLWHNKFKSEDLFDYSFDLPCHTQYMFAPEGFSNADFERLSRAEDFTFAFEPEDVNLPLEQRLPCFVFVQTGNGLRGVIRVNGIAPEGRESVGGVEYAVNPCLSMDIKFPRNFSEEELR